MMTMPLLPTRFLSLRNLPLALSLAAAMPLMSGCSSEAATPAPARPVLVMTVAGAGAASAERSIPGVVVARYASDVGFQVAGRIGQRLVEVGQQVRKGQPLMRLDDSDYRQALIAAKAEAGQAEADARRFRGLVADGAVSLADNERQQARAAAAAAQYQLAGNRVRYATLTAPYDGVITAIRAEAGQVVSEGMPVVSLARLGEVEIAADIPEELVADLARQKAQVEVWGSGDERHDLRLRELSPAASQPLRTYRARFAMPGLEAKARDRLHLGMTAEVLLSGPAGGAPGVSLPASALVKSAGEPAVWVLPEQAEHLSLQRVQVLAYQNDTVLVGGLAAGTRVVTTGVQKLDAGLRVRAVERSGASPDLPGGKRS